MASSFDIFHTVALSLASVYCTEIGQPRFSGVFGSLGVCLLQKNCHCIICYY